MTDDKNFRAVQFRCLLFTCLTIWAQFAKKKKKDGRRKNHKNIYITWPKLKYPKEFFKDQKKKASKMIF